MKRCYHQGFTVRRTTVRKERLGDILERHAGKSRESTFSRSTWKGPSFKSSSPSIYLKHRPKILLVEAVAPLEFHETSAVWQS